MTAYRDDGLDRAVVCEEHGEAYHPDHRCERCPEMVVCEYDNTEYDPDDGCPACFTYAEEMLAEYAWMGNAVAATRALGTYGEQMLDAGRGHLLRGDES